MSSTCQDWGEVEVHLQKLLVYYKQHGMAGRRIIHFVIKPLHQRFSVGERTEELYVSIMSEGLDMSRLIKKSKRGR